MKIFKIMLKRTNFFKNFAKNEKYLKFGKIGKIF